MIGIRRSRGVVVVAVVGSLGRGGATRLAATLSDLIQGQGNLAIAVNLRGVDRIAASGVQVLSVAAFELERRGGRLWLCDAPAGVLRALDLAGLVRVVGSPLRDEVEHEGAPEARRLSQMQNMRARADHPAGSGRRGSVQGRQE